MAKKTEHKGIYIDPLTDFGFKRLFGDQDLMIDFLTSVLNLKDGITNIRYGNTVDKHLKEKQFLSHIQLMYTDILQPYYDKLTIVYLELPLFTKKVKELKTNVDHWMYALKYLPKLARLPAVMRKGIFTRLFDLAKIAKMTKRQQNAYYKSLHDMNIIKHTINDLQSTIVSQGNTIVTQGNTIATLQSNNAALQSNNAALQSNNAAQAQELDEYRRRYGSLNGSVAQKKGLPNN